MYISVKDLHFLNVLIVVALDPTDVVHRQQPILMVLRIETSIVLGIAEAEIKGRAQPRT